MRWPFTRAGCFRRLFLTCNLCGRDCRDLHSRSGKEIWIFGYGSVIWKPVSWPSVHAVLSEGPHADYCALQGFDYALRVDGYIKGFRCVLAAVLHLPYLQGSEQSTCRRVFYQGSTDHRGTPSRPGRTATLESAANCVTWGTAFRLAGSFEQQLETLQYLECVPCC